ncbi:putative cAMP receptor [Tricladium varicosporioides]|nr:putative cAMP receptor [Hymenoscyphus varicosporioides]
MTLTHNQLHALTIVERSASVLSWLGVVTIISTFICSRHFRNPVNRLIFINAFYNIFDVTATTISLSGPKAGNNSALCQFQGFLMQMFPLTDVLWTLAMAIDVFLIVYYKYDAEDLRKLEIKYISAITAFCFIPALSFLFVRTREKGPMYASVTLWCSIAPHWVLFRIIFFYGPIWLAIFIVFLLYSLVGIEILKQRRLFKDIGSQYITLDTPISANNAPFNHTPKVDTTTISPNTHPRPVHIPNFSRKDPESVTSSLSTSYNPPSPNSPVSFRQYILMPLMFFIVLLAIWVAPTANRVGAFIDHHFESYPLLLAVGAMGSLRGFWNGVVFLIVGIKARKRRKG